MPETVASPPVRPAPIVCTVSLLASLARRFTALQRRAPRDAQGSALITARQIYILPTRAGLGYGVLLFVTLIGALNYQNNLGLLLTFLAISVTLVSMHHAWFNLLQLRVSAQAGAPVFCGQPARFVVTLTDTRQRARLGLGVRGAAGLITVPAGGQAALELYLPTQRRGLLPLTEVRVETRYPLGLFCAWSWAEVAAVGLVYPRPAPRAAVPSSWATLDPEGQGDQGSGVEDYVGPRPYRAGDSLRRVDWKALARERGLIVKQFGGDRAARLWLDWSHLPPGDPEWKLSLLCRQVLDAAGQDLVYGLRLPGVIVARGRGDAHRHRCLAALARFGSEH